MQSWKITLMSVVLLATQASAVTQATLHCTSPFIGKTLTHAELSRVIAAHQTWLNSDRKASTGKANLCKATLHGMDLTGQNLSYADLSGSDLSNAKLQQVNLSHANLVKAYFRWSNCRAANFFGADLTAASFEDTNLTNADLRQTTLIGANLANANLTNANLRGANLQAADLSGANLTNVDLSWANLQDANLSHAKLNNAIVDDVNLNHANLNDAQLNNAKFINSTLTYASLKGTDVSGADFTGANFNNIIYQPQLKTLPDLIALTTVKNLRTMQFANLRYGIAALAELRTAYKKLGVRSMERKLTAIIKFQEMRRAWHAGGWGYLESTVSYMLFYLPSHYGASPGRPLGIVLLLILLLAIPYRFALWHPSKRSGILVTWTIKRFYHWDKTRNPEKAEKLTMMLKSQSATTFRSMLKLQLRALRTALFFSLLSAFNIGWRELNVGHWLLRLQTREYILKGKGWVRAVAGLQAVVSAYLIVLWALTYFGRPFEW